MFAKVSFFYLVFVVVTLTGSAYPNADHNNNDSSEEQHHHHKGDAHNHTKGHQHEKSNEHHHHHGESPYNGSVDVKIKSDSPFMKVKNLTEELYNEIFVIASGDNYASPELPNDVHVKARAIVLQSQTLRDMLYIYPIFHNVTLEYALKGAKVEDRQTMIDLINDLVTNLKGTKLSRFETLKSTITAGTFMMRGQYFKVGATPQEKAEAYDKWLWNPFVGAASMNKLFYRAVWKNDRPEYKILRAMVDSAKYVENEKLERIYATVVTETVKKVCPAHDNRKAAFVFYQNLLQALSEDAALLISLYQGKEMIPGMMFDKPF